MKTAFPFAALLFAWAAFSVWMSAQKAPEPQTSAPTVACCISCEEINNLRRQAIQSEDLSEIRQAKADLLDDMICLEQQPSCKRELGCLWHGIGSLYSAEQRAITGADEDLSDKLLDSALYFTLKAQQIRLDILNGNVETENDSIYSIHAAQSFYNAGLILFDKKEYFAAIQNFENAIGIYQTYNPALVSDVLRDIGKSWNAIGDYKEAKNYLNEAVRTANKPEQFYRAYIELGTSLNFLGEHRSALDSLKKALYLLSPSDAGPADWLACYQNIGDANDYLHQYDSALVYFNKALEWCGNDDRRSGILNFIGISQRKAGNFAAARITLEEALKTAGSPDRKAQTCDNLGEVYFSENRFEDALYHFRKAKNTLLGEQTSTDLANVAYKSDLVTYLFDEGRALKRLGRGNDTLALAAFRQADALLDLMRKEQRTEEAKLAWRQDMIALYELAIQTCFQLEKPDEAFYFLEKSKSVLLYDALTRSDARNILGDSLSNALLILQKDLTTAREKYANEPDANGLYVIQTSEKKLESLLKGIQQKYPNFSKAYYEAQVIPLDSLYRMLEQNACFIHYFYGDSNIYAMAMYKDGHHYFNTIPRNSIDGDLRRFIGFFSPRDNTVLNDNNAQDYLDRGYKLYNMLLKPVLRPGCESAIIVPDGPLTRLPFDALLTRAATWDESGFDQAPFLLNEMQIQTAWSASILWHFQSSAQSLSHNASRLAFFSVEKFDKFNLNPLSFPARLLTRFGDLFGRESQKTFRNATKADFESSRSGFKAYHFHTHAITDSLAPPRLVFSDTMMYMAEFYQLPLEADLLVMGACETNAGDYERSEGVYSLSRALAYSGVPSVISSLWKVKPNATEELFGYFYENLKKGQTKAASIHEAKRSFIRLNQGKIDKTTPLAWAAWTFAGRDNTLSFGSSDHAGKWMWCALAIAILLAVSIIFGRKFKNNKPR